LSFVVIKIKYPQASFRSCVRSGSDIMFTPQGLLSPLRSSSASKYYCRHVCRPLGLHLQMDIIETPHMRRRCLSYIILLACQDYSITSLNPIVTPNLDDHNDRQYYEKSITPHCGSIRSGDGANMLVVVLVRRIFFSGYEGGKMSLFLSSRVLSAHCSKLTTTVNCLNSRPSR